MTDFVYSGPGRYPQENGRGCMFCIECDGTLHGFDANGKLTEWHPKTGEVYWRRQSHDLRHLVGPRLPDDSDAVKVLREALKAMCPLVKTARAFMAGEQAVYFREQCLAAEKLAKQALEQTGGA